MSGKTLGIYIHVPFCLRKCSYCDFCSFPGVGKEVMHDYVSALTDNIAGFDGDLSGYTVDTVYFGGGTPTLLPIVEFDRIMTSVRKKFRVSEDAEITTECNPATADAVYFSELIGMGVNRLSLGAQSANENELRALGRIHGWRDVENAVFDAKNAGFENISLDLMFGIPEQTAESFENTVEKTLALEPEHISAYGLIIEPGTPISENLKNLVLPDEDLEYTMYADVNKRLADRGLYRYEISNFSKPGRESRHNLKYWRREEYLGFGASAHSFFGEKRFFATDILDSYMSGNYVSGSQNIGIADAECEYIMLSMRLREGVSEAELDRRFGVSFEEKYGGRLKKFIDAGLIVREDGRCAFTDRGFWLSNAVLSDILDFS